MVKGIVEGCRQSDCALLGGEVSDQELFIYVILLVAAVNFSDTAFCICLCICCLHSKHHFYNTTSSSPEGGSAMQTAEMPGMYQAGEYDVAGFAVGSVKQDKVIDGKRIQEGDALVALPSSGLHSNGFSLVRKVVEVRTYTSGLPCTMAHNLDLCSELDPRHAEV